MAGVIGHRFGALRGLFAMLLVATGLTWTLAASPAAAAQGSGVSVTITSLTPNVLGDSGTVRLSGVVENGSKQRWSKLQAYLLIRPTPFTDRQDLHEQAALDNGFTGTRIIEPGRFEELGALDPNTSATFTLSIPVDELPITGTDGVYPIGVQILGTDAEGRRDANSIARATTFLPRMEGDHPEAASTVVWSLLMPSARAADGTIVEADELLESMAPGGQLRNLLDLVSAAAPIGRGVVVDPALVDAADDLAQGRAAGHELTPIDTSVAEHFRDDLIAVASLSSALILDYDRTDVLGLHADADARQYLFSAVERATDAVIDDFGLSRNRISWPSASGVSASLFRTLRERGDDPVLVQSTALPDWDPTAGLLVGYRTSSGDLPLLVVDDITRDVPGRRTLATLHQQVYADAALASLSSAERRESMVFVGPSYDPGPAATWTHEDTSFATARPLSMLTRADRYRGKIARATADPISSQQVAVIDGAARTADLLSSAAVDSPDLDDSLARQIAGVLGIRWRSDRAAGLSAANAVATQISSQLSSITVMAPPEVTLSSSEGGFPITITNGSTTAISVGLRMRSSNPALHFADQPPVVIAAGERRTVTVDVDLKEQNITTVTVHLMAPDGRTFGSTDEFIIRSSQVGAVLWAAMGAAGLFVVFALVRRFRRRGSGASSPAGDPDE